MSHNNSHIIDFSNVVDTDDTDKIVIFAEAPNASVVWDWEGHHGQPVDPDKHDSFANAARDWSNKNPLIVQSDGSYKPIEVKYLIAYGRNEMTIEFNKLKKSGFVDKDTKLIVMGHAGRVFAGENPRVWQEVITDTGFRNEFSEVAYAACSQGESQNICMDLSRSFGSDTVVHAQVGQTWGVADSPAHFIERGRNSSPNFVSRHPVPINEFSPDPTGKATPVTHWTQQLFTVGSGRVTFPGGHKNPIVLSGGDDEYKIHKGLGLQEANAFIQAQQDPNLLAEYRAKEADFFGEYIGANPQPETPWRSDFPGMYTQKNRGQLQRDVIVNLGKEWWAETHDGADLPADKQYSPETQEYMGYNALDFNPAEDDAFYEWWDEREAKMIADGTLEPLDYGMHKDMIQFEIDTLEELEQNRQYTPDELAANRAYDQAWDDWGTARDSYDIQYDKAFSESGLISPPYIGGEHLLDSEDDIPFTFDEFSTDPNKAFDVMAGGASYGDLQIQNRTDMLKDLARGGNETAIAAFSEAMVKVDEIDPLLYDNNALIYGYLSDIEALRLYSESGAGTQYRAE